MIVAAAEANADIGEIYPGIGDHPLGQLPDLLRRVAKAAAVAEAGVDQHLGGEGADHAGVVVQLMLRAAGAKAPVDHAGRAAGAPEHLPQRDHAVLFTPSGEVGRPVEHDLPGSLLLLLILANHRLQIILPDLNVPQANFYRHKITSLFPYT